MGVQAERERLINSLTTKIREKNWKELLEGGSDPELQWCVSEHDRYRVIDQASLICRALQIAQEKTEKGDPFQWVSDCCGQAVVTLNSHYAATTVADWYRKFHQGEDESTKCRHRND